MPVNSSKGEMYPGFHTWNPIRGKCLYECTYCFMRTGRLSELKGYQEPPHLVEKELETKLGFGKDIFVGSTIGMWDPEIPAEWIERVLQHCCEADELASDLFGGIVAIQRRVKGKQGVERFHGKRKSYSRAPNRYLFQSKNPERFNDFIEFMPLNTTLGTTIETTHHALYRDMGISKAPRPWRRKHELNRVNSNGMDTMVSIEPVIDFDLATFVQWMEDIEPDYVSIGAESKGVFKQLGIPQPSQDKVIDLVRELSGICDVRLKPNLRHLPGAYSQEEFMDELIDAGGIWPPYEE